MLKDVRLQLCMEWRNASLFSGRYSLNVITNLIWLNVLDYNFDKE